MSNKVQNNKDSLKEEIINSERLRAYILTGLLGLEAFALLIIYQFYREEYIMIFNTNMAIYAIFIFTALIILYEFLFHFFIQKHNRIFLLSPKFYGYLNSFAEISLLTALFIFIVEYSGQTVILQAPATLTYFLFIVLSTLRLDLKLSIFTGFIAAIQFIAVSVYYSTAYGNTPADFSHPDLTGMQYLGQGVIMIIAGTASGFVANRIKNKITLSIKNLQEKNEVIDLFGQQISQQIVSSILKNPGELSGSRKKVCVMFLDIRDFTPFMEKQQPEMIVSYLNTLFKFMIESVQQHHGVINQFLGDGFMATFGAPVSKGNICQHAVEASEEIIKSVDEKYRSGNIPKTRIGIGIHYGEALIGNIGSSVRKQYSITGKVVVLASRIEQLSKHYKSQLIISEDVYSTLNEQTQTSFISLGANNIKGSSNSVTLYRIKE